MRGKARKYLDDVFQHIFQNTWNQFLIFYSTEDRLVFYTLFSVMARRYHIVVLALALMYDHVHSLVKSESLCRLARFVGTFTSTFVMAFNRDAGRKGPLFRKAYGNAPKRGDKKVRTCIAYNYNNSVEKKLFTRAEEDRWNFLAYLGSPHPFSEKIQLDKASRKLRQSLVLVREWHARNRYLEYGIIRRLFDGLEEKERDQLLDYIIHLYLPIDKDAVLGYYRSYEDMVSAINSNTGSEYDIKEDYDPESHRCYTRMLEIVAQSSFAGNPKCIIAASPEKKRQIAEVLMRRTGAKWYQVKRFLHLE